MIKHLSATAWFEAIQIQFNAVSNPQKASAMEAYMKNHFRFLGIPKPIRAIETKKLFSMYGKPSLEILDELVPMLWEMPIREHHYFAMECLYHQRKHFRESDIYLFESLMNVHSWWDTIDFISPNLAGSLCQKFPHLLVPTCIRWNADNHFWIRRASLIIQLRYKQHPHPELLFDMIRPLMLEKEFFIRKAIGWSLRELAKSQPEKVLSFVENNPISPLSKREALKHVKKTA
jgi:3-methyladenine DNA glycosylase AlkD